MMLAFTLTMPGRSSWNGAWSGDGAPYVLLRAIRWPERERAAALLSQQPYPYSWPDGWRATVTVREVSSNDARRLRRTSRGFCGYDWMVDSLLKNGSISPAKEK